MDRRCKKKSFGLVFTFFRSLVIGWVQITNQYATVYHALVLRYMAGFTNILSSAFKLNLESLEIIWKLFLRILYHN